MIYVCTIYNYIHHTYSIHITYITSYVKCVICNLPVYASILSTQGNL